MASSEQVSSTVDRRSAAFEALANSQRRHVLAYLSERSEDDPVHIDGLIDQVIARELVDGNSTVDPDSVAATLHHVHLPKLDDLGLVDYDPETNVVSPVEDEAAIPDFDRVSLEESSA